MENYRKNTKHFTEHVTRVKWNRFGNFNENIFFEGMNGRKRFVHIINNYVGYVSQTGQNYKYLKETRS